MSGPAALVDPGLSLGDILGAALAAADNDRAERLAADATYYSAKELARQVAPFLHLPMGDVFDALTFMPNSMLCLLATPEGWGALANYVATETGANTTHYLPTRH